MRASPVTVLIDPDNSRTILAVDWNAVMILGIVRRTIVEREGAAGPSTAEAGTAAIPVLFDTQIETVLKEDGPFEFPGWLIGCYGWGYVRTNLDAAFTKRHATSLFPKPLIVLVKLHFRQREVLKNSRNSSAAPHFRLAGPNTASQLQLPATPKTAREDNAIPWHRPH